MGVLVLLESVFEIAGHSLTVAIAASTLYLGSNTIMDVIVGYQFVKAAVCVSMAIKYHFSMHHRKILAYIIFNRRIRRRYICLHLAILCGFVTMHGSFMAFMSAPPVTKESWQKRIENNKNCGSHCKDRNFGYNLYVTSLQQ